MSRSDPTNTARRRTALEAYLAECWPGTVVSAFYVGWSAGKAEQRALTDAEGVATVDGDDMEARR